MLTELIGNVFTLKHTCKVAGVPTDAASVTFTIKSPTGAVTTGSFTRHTGTGLNEYDYKPTVTAHHLAEVVTTSPDSAASVEFYVLPSPVT